MVQTMTRRTRRHMDYRGLMRVMGWLLMIESGFLLMPLAASLAYGGDDTLAFGVSAAVTFASGLALYRFNRHHRGEMSRRDGFMLTAMVWVVFSIYGMLPLLLSGSHLSVADAFFEAMSGFTTTGASVLTGVEHFSAGVHLWRSLMQWIGGMGIILFTLAVLPMLNSSAGVQMFNAETTGVFHDKLHPRIGKTAMHLWGIYTALTLTLFALLWLGPMDCFDSLCHAMSTMSTGGFSTRNDSIGAWDSLYVKTVVTVFMFLGGVNFVLLYGGVTGHLKRMWANETFRKYVELIGVMFVLFVAAIVAGGQYKGFESVTIDPLFQIVSTITSTGYTVSDFESWGPFVLALMFVLMFFGACAGSTSGGAKIDRGIYLIKNCRNEVRRSLHPTRVYSVSINGRVLPYELVSKVIAFLCIYVLMIVFGGLVLTAMGMPLIDSFFSAFSCMSNTGLGAGVTGYGGSYDLVPEGGKWVLSLLMLIGRLEIFTVLVLFVPSFWRK